MTREELEKRAAEIDSMQRDKLSTDELVKLAEERESIASQLAELRLKAAKEAEERSKIAEDKTMPVITTPENKTGEKRYTAASPEYRSAFFKRLMSDDDSMSTFTAEERAAYTTVTTDSTSHTEYLMPTETVNRIWDLLEEQHVILDDIDVYRSGVTMEFPIRQYIAQGDAKSVDEATANDDEKNVWGKLTLSGKDFSKHVDVSYKMRKMSVDAFESYIVGEIAERLGSALAAEVFTQIASGYDTTNNTITTAAAKAVAFKDIANALATLKNREGSVAIYANYATVYKYLVGMVDTTGRPIFQPDAQAGREGTLIGHAVKIDDAVADDVIWLGYPKQVKGNFVEDIMIETERDIKKHVVTYSGYACFDCGLIAPKAFAKLTVKQS